MGRLEGKVALVSGGARGIGAACASFFAREGAAVVIGDLLEKEGASTADQIVRSGGRARFERMDVTAEADWDRAIATASRNYGRLDILVNNAGIAIARPSFFEVTPSDWEKTMAVNSTGVFLGARAVAPLMKERRSGSIVNISSISGLVGISASAGYAASKGAVRVFTKYLAIQLAPFNVRANSIHPGVVRTDLTAKSLADAAAMKRNLELHPLGRVGQPEDIAAGALYLASDESSWVTGAELVIDGGYTAR
ncbi:MAG: glucose 1-dehydrogenase [SAR202 cluster bacterium]|nr:glucose 1-dehydrogenase [SAR202 cluster bacterium]